MGSVPGPSATHWGAALGLLVRPQTRASRRPRLLCGATPEAPLALPSQEGLTLPSPRGVSGKGILASSTFLESMLRPQPGSEGLWC